MWALFVNARVQRNGLESGNDVTRRQLQARRTLVVPPLRDRSGPRVSGVGEGRSSRPVGRVYSDSYLNDNWILVR